jgi:hypothetical protein
MLWSRAVFFFFFALEQYLGNISFTNYLFVVHYWNVLFQRYTFQKDIVRVIKQVSFNLGHVIYSMVY